MAPRSGSLSRNALIVTACGKADIAWTCGHCSFGPKADFHSRHPMSALRESASLETVHSPSAEVRAAKQHRHHQDVAGRACGIETPSAPPAREGAPERATTHSLVGRLGARLVDAARLPSCYKWSSQLGFLP